MDSIGLADSTAGKTALDRVRMRDLLYGFTRTQTLHTAVRFGLPELLAAGPLPPAALAERAGADPDALGRLLRGLAAMGVVVAGEDNRYALTAFGEGLLPGAEGSLHGLTSLVGAEYHAAWGRLPETVRDGRPGFDLAFGEPLFAYLGEHPETSERFNRWMAAATGTTAAAVVAAYDFSSFGRVVDVGGGYGALVAAVLRAFPGPSGVLFDLPAVVAKAGPHLEAAGVADRCQLVGGDFFAAVPEGGDAYLLSQILHDWDDDRCVRILTNIRRAMAPAGRVLAVEVVLPERVTGPSFAVDQDLMMLVVTGGRERTETEYGRLFAEAGLALTRVIATASTREAHVVEATAG